MCVYIYMTKSQMITNQWLDSVSIICECIQKQII